MTKNNSKNRLGTGLSALLGSNTDYLRQGKNSDSQKSMVLRAVKTVPIESLEPNPNNPRKNFSEKSIKELADSIKEKNVIQPVLVRFIGRREDGVRYQIIAGERRWRAAQKAGLMQMPVLETNVADEESKELALIENIQRENLNAIEEAHGYKNLMQNKNMDINKMMRILGKSRSHIINTIRLLGLPEEVQNMVIDGSISAGHARTLINHRDAVAIARKIHEKQLSVRQTEEIVRVKKVEKEEIHQNENDTIKNQENQQQNQYLLAKDFEKEIADNLGLRTKVNVGKKGGKIVLYYKNDEQFEQIYRKLIQTK